MLRNFVRERLRDLAWWAMERLSEKPQPAQPFDEEEEEEPATFVRAAPTVSPEARAMIAEIERPDPPKDERPKPLEGSLEARIEEARRMR